MDVNCGICGEKISITKRTAYDKIKKHLNGHRLGLSKILGYYLSNKAREYE